MKVFFTESFKFYISLYGHKLPVLSKDISSDGALLASGYADKNIMIWGMDFGDCRKSIFAHGDSVMAVQFVPKPHYMFSAGKDGVVKGMNIFLCDKIPVSGFRDLLFIGLGICGTPPSTNFNQ